ncbi:MAG: cell division protein FtsA [Candidatus Riflebacteria bacterium]|nr:cell division protein FtsA [Candidatus Riflebacteria bacterium]
MATNNIIFGLDIGTTKISTIAAEIDDSGGINVIGIGLAPSLGLRKGIVVNIEETTRSILESVSEAEKMADVVIDYVYVGVAGSHISSFNTKGVVAVAGEEREISGADIQRAIEAAKTFAVPPNREIIHILPRSFTVDDQTGIKDPVGMSGVRLEVDVHIVMGAVTAIQNLIKSCHRAHLDVANIVLEPIASAEAVLTPDEKELGVCLVDIGGGTTDLAVFSQGSIVHSSVLPIGGNHVTNDIAVGLRTTTARAEELKVKHAAAIAELDRGDNSLEVLNTGGDATRTVTSRSLCEIVEPRMEEIFQLVRADLAKADCLELLSAGLVLTGGTSLMRGTTHLASRVFDLPARVGRPLNLKGLSEKVSSPLFATGVGLIHYGLANQATHPLGHYQGSSLFEILFDRIRSWFRELF